MAKSSINFQKASSHSMKHNFREDEPSYLLQEKDREPNEYWRHEKTAEQIFNDEVSKIEKGKKGKRPKFENSHWEAVLNLNGNHTMDEVRKVAEHIEKKFNITCTAIAIHRDEGHYTDNGHAVKNYHAHLNFCTYKDLKQNWRLEKIKPQDLRELQTEIAGILKMERGIDKRESKTERLEHREYKQKEREKAELKKELFNTKEALEQLRKDSKNQGFTAEYFKELNKAKKELTFKDQEAFNEWKQDLIKRHTKKGVFRDKTDTEAILTEQFDKIEQLNDIIQATEQSKEQELKQEKEKLKQEQERIIQAEKTQLQTESREYIFKREKEIQQENNAQTLKSKIQELKNEAIKKAKEIANYLLEITRLNEIIEKQKKENERLQKIIDFKDDKINELESDLKAEKEKNDKLQALNTQNALNAKETPLNDKEKEQQEIENGEYLYFKERENRKSGESKYIFFTKTQHKNYVANNLDDTRKLSELFSFEKNEVLSALDLHKTLVKFARARKTEQNKEPKKDLNKNRGGLER